MEQERETGNLIAKENLEFEILEQLITQDMHNKEFVEYSANNTVDIFKGNAIVSLYSDRFRLK
jgi:hypothetical protein